MIAPRERSASAPRAAATSQRVNVAPTTPSAAIAPLTRTVTAPRCVVTRARAVVRSRPTARPTAPAPKE